MTAAAGFFTVMTIFIQPAAEHLHPFEVLFFRSLVGVALMVPWMVHVGRGALRTQRFGLHFSRTALNGAAMMIWFYAIPLVPLADAVTLSFTAPLFTTVLAVLFLREVVRLRRWAAVTVGFAGILIILRPGFAKANLGNLLLLFNGMIWAGAMIMIRSLTRTESPNAIVAYLFILMVPISLVPALFVWQTPPLAALPWLVIIGAAGVAGHLCTTRAIAAAEASLVMPFDYLRLPMFVLVGLFVFGEIPDVWTLVGAAIIVGSAIYIGHREAKLARRRPNRIVPWRPGPPDEFIHVGRKSSAVPPIAAILTSCTDGGLHASGCR